MINCAIIGMSGSKELSNNQTYYALPSCPLAGCRFPGCKHHINSESGDIYNNPPRELVMKAAKEMLTNLSDADNIDMSIRKVFDEAAGYKPKEEPLVIGKPDPIVQEDINELKKHTKTKDISNTIEFKEEEVLNLEGTVMTEAIQGRTLDIGIIGVGGAGNHIADAFGKQGYDVMVINLTDRDYSHLTNIPNDEFSRIELIVGAGGAGKNPEVGAQAIREYTNTLLKKIQRKFNNKEFIFVAYGLGGGTGTIGGTLVAEIASSLNIPVGAIVTLPRKNEGTDEKLNCLKGLQEVANFKGIKSILVIDNQKVVDRLKDIKDNNFWSIANDEVVNLFDRFNRMSSVASNTAFDAEDYKKCLMTPGFLVMGSSEVQTNKLATTAEEQLKTAVAAIHSGLLADGFDHSSAIRAAGLITRPITYDYSHAFEESLFSYLKGEIGAGGLNRGIYQSDVLKDNIVIDTMIAGMGLPQQRVKDLIAETKQETDAMNAKVQQRMSEQISLDIPSSDLISGTPSSAVKRNMGSGSSLLNRRTSSR